MSDVKNNSASQEAVKNLDTEASEMQAEVKIETNEKDNLLKALHQERSERKELKKKLEEFEAKEKAKQEKELAEQGKFKELLETKELEAKTIKEQYEKMNAELERYRESENKKLETLKAQAKEKLGESKFSTIEKLLAGKPTFEQMELLPELINSIIPQQTNVNNIPTNTSTMQTSNTSEYEKKLKSGDILGALSSRKYN